MNLPRAGSTNGVKLMVNSARTAYLWKDTADRVASNNISNKIRRHRFTNEDRSQVYLGRFPPFALLSRAGVYVLFGFPLAKQLSSIGRSSLQDTDTLFIDQRKAEERPSVPSCGLSGAYNVEYREGSIKAGKIFASQIDNSDPPDSRTCSIEVQAERLRGVQEWETALAV